MKECLPGLEDFSISGMLALPIYPRAPTSIGLMFISGYAWEGAGYVKHRSIEVA